MFHAFSTPHPTFLPGWQLLRILFLYFLTTLAVGGLSKNVKSHKKRSQRPVSYLSWVSYEV